MSRVLPPARSLSAPLAGRVARPDAAERPSRRRLFGFAAAGLVAMAAGVSLWSAAPSAHAQSGEALHFEGSVDGVQTTLLLQRRGDRFDGELQEGALRLPVQGEVRGPRWQGRLTLPGGFGLTLPFEADLQGSAMQLRIALLPGTPPASLTLHRAGAPATPGAAPTARGSAPQGAGRIEPALVGRWVRDSTINSSGGAGGFASFSTRRTLQFAADGRVLQTLRSAGGGGSWSHASGEQVEFAGRWEVRGDTLWLAQDGQAQFQPAGRVSLVDGRLVVYHGQGRQIWTR